MLNNVEVVVANSKYTKNLAEMSFVDEDKIIIINPGADPVSRIK